MRPRRIHAAAIITYLGALLLAGCGASSTGHPAAQGHATPSQSNSDVQRARVSDVPNDGDGASHGANPCRLVSRPEAQAITGKAIEGISEAPLGPTCVYKVARTSPITVSVESISLARAARQLQRPTRLTLHGRRAYCGRLGSQMLFVAAPGGRVLHVIAPCGQAARFAALALHRLAA